MSPRPRVTRLGPDDWQVFRSIRLAALAESPEAFGSSLAFEQTMDETAWRDRVATSTRLVAWLGDRSVGTVSVRAHAERAAEGMITAMWVDPSARGHGLGGLLVDAAVEAWRAVGGVSIGMTCVESNEPAMQLYRRKGFEPTGRTWPMDDGRVEVELLRAL